MRAYTRTEVLDYCEDPNNSDEDRKAVVEEFYRTNPDFRLKCLWFGSDKGGTVRCQEIYKQQSTVKEHCWTQHLRIKRFQCEYPGCDRKFKKKQHMSLHWEAKHSGERKYRCDLCHFRFKHNKHLKRHEKCQHQYPCRYPGCHLTFINKTGKNSLRLHEEDYHSGAPRHMFTGGLSPYLQAGAGHPYGSVLANVISDTKYNPSAVTASAPLASPAAHLTPAQQRLIAEALAGQHGPEAQQQAIAATGHLQHLQHTHHHDPAHNNYGGPHSPTHAGNSNTLPVLGHAHSMPPVMPSSHHQHHFSNTSPYPTQYPHPLHAAAAADIAAAFAQSRRQGQAVPPSAVAAVAAGWPISDPAQADLFSAAKSHNVSCSAVPPPHSTITTPRKLSTGHNLPLSPSSAPHTPARASAMAASTRQYPHSARRASDAYHVAMSAKRYASVSPTNHMQRRMMLGEQPKPQLSPTSSTSSRTSSNSPSPTSSPSPLPNRRMPPESTGGVSPTARRRLDLDANVVAASPRSEQHVKRERPSGSSRHGMHANIRDPHFHNYSIPQQHPQPGTLHHSRSLPAMSASTAAADTLAALVSGALSTAAAAASYENRSAAKNNGNTARFPPATQQQHPSVQTPSSASNNNRDPVSAASFSSVAQASYGALPTLGSGGNTEPSSPQHGQQRQRQHVAPLPVRPAVGPRNAPSVFDFQGAVRHESNSQPASPTNNVQRVSMPRLQRSQSDPSPSPSPGNTSDASSPEYFAASCLLSNSAEDLSMASKNRRAREESDNDVNGGDLRSAKRQKTFHHHHRGDHDESPVRALANVGRLPEHHSSTSGDESGKSTPVGGHSRRESGASFVSDTASSCGNSGVAGDSEREDEVVVGAACHDKQHDAHPHQFHHRPNYLAPTPPPLVGTPELSAMARMQVSPAIPSAAR